MNEPTKNQPDDKLTIAEVCAELRIARSTFYEWKKKEKSPPGKRIPNGEYRITRRDLDDWYHNLEAA